MEPLAIMMIGSSARLADGARSALPDAPVVADAPRVGAALRSRAAAASALRRLADAVAPPARTRCAQAAH